MATAKEVWKPLAGTNSTYEISSKGKIRSWIKRGPVKATLDAKPHDIKTYFQGKCECVNVPLDGKMHVRSLTKLVAEAFPEMKTVKEVEETKTPPAKAKGAKSDKPVRKVGRPRKEKKELSITPDVRKSLKQTLKSMEQMAVNVMSILHQLGVE